MTDELKTGVKNGMILPTVNYEGSKVKNVAKTIATQLIEKDYNVNLQALDVDSHYRVTVNNFFEISIEANDEDEEEGVAIEIRQGLWVSQIDDILDVVRSVCKFFNFEMS